MTSGVVKHARAIVESPSRDIGQPTAECLLMVWPSRRRLVTWEGGLLPVQGGAEGTEERVSSSCTEVCDKSVTSNASLR